MKQDTDYIGEMDLQWLFANKWTIPGNLAYRKLLAELNQGILSQERIEQLCMQHELPEDQITKIKVSLQELIKLRNELSNLS
jgi:hypothetical protein